MPGAAWLPPRRLGPLSESSAKLVAPATDRFVRDHDATLEQQLLDVAQAQAEPEVPANGAADDDSRETVAVIKRFGLLHRFILPPRLQQPDSALPRRQMNIRAQASRRWADEPTAVPLVLSVAKRRMILLWWRSATRARTP